MQMNEAMHASEAMRARAVAVPLTPETLPPLARLGLLLAVCAGSWAVLLGLGYGAARLF
jgi:hypothetical protein